MNEKPMFSVVIPIYNKGPHITRAINSVLKQTVSDFEILLINDASTDNSMEEAKKIIDSRIRIFNREQPGPGGYAARNLGILQATAEWVAFLDADDEWFPDHLEKMLSLSIQFPGINIMGCGWAFNRQNVSIRNKYFISNFYKGNHILDVKTYILKYINKQPALWTSIACVKLSSPIVKDLFPDANKAKRGGDLYAWLKMICYHKEMAWSAHLGAIYHQDSVNMVTKLASSMPNLMEREIYEDLGKNLDSKEKKLLKSYLNIQLRNAWIGNIARSNPNFKLLPRIYFGGNIFIVFILILISISPKFILKILVKLKMR